jgi:glycerol uptake facilitator protein
MDAYFGELVGTGLLMLLGNGVVANVVLAKTKGHNAGWIVINFGFAMAVFVAVWCVGEMSGAHLNPAVSLGLALAGKFAWAKMPGYIAAQFLGAFIGAVLVFLFYRDHYTATNDADAKLGTFATGPAIRDPMRNLFCEAIGTFVLVFAVLMVVEPTFMWTPTPTNTAVAAGAEIVEGLPAGSGAKIGLGTLGALPVGLLVLSIGLSLGGTTGYGINPARDLAPRLAHALLPVPGKRDSDWGYAWIPVVGPLLGAVLAFLLHYACNAVAGAKV